MNKNEILKCIHYHTCSQSKESLCSDQHCTINKTKDKEK
jgi:hypothetical protein